MQGIYRRFLDGVPYYLARHYWWAYLWKRSVWFFDHQPIINAILFGQYRRLMQATLERLPQPLAGRVLQLTCVYGSLTPTLLSRLQGARLHITDAAAVQLSLAASKVKPGQQLLATRMNAEQLAYRADSFNTVVLFFLLHEMPDSARLHTLAECMRVIAPGGVLLITEYAPLPVHHFLYRIAPFRWLLTWLEPFLAGFWHMDVASVLNTQGNAVAKHVELESDIRLFNGFYRVSRYKVSANTA